MSQDDRSQELEGTRVDLGDDLLRDETASVRPETGETPQLEDLDDALQSARILLNEGFVEEAKRLYRKILIRDGSRIEAKIALAEIHESELKNIFDGRRDFRKRAGTAPDIDPVLIWGKFDSEEVSQRLELDLDLLPSPLELLSHAAEEEIYADAVAMQLKNEPIQGLLDSAVSFLQMGMGSAAAKLLEVAASRVSDRKAEIDLLTAQAHFLARRWLEAAAALQDLMARPEEMEDALVSVEAYYWMGRIDEASNRSLEAVEWYVRAFEMDATHRDLQDRLMKLTGGRG